MPAGATTPRQFSTTTSSPDSRSEGTSGSDGRRSALDTASARTVPASICGSISESPKIPMVDRPDRTVVSASPPPE
jgi:hypothetical protein